MYREFLVLLDLTVLVFFSMSQGCLAEKKVQLITSNQCKPPYLMGSRPDHAAQLLRHSLRHQPGWEADPTAPMTSLIGCCRSDWGLQITG